ncbi:MAG: hypothetical protein AB7H96_23955 [Vicinamibacterales bacterium]
MAISEQDLRAMIREAISRHAGGAAPREPHPVPDAPRTDGTFRVHASHSLFVVAGTPDGECVIEPDHRCDHCGYCKSLGH